MGISSTTRTRRSSLARPTNINLVPALQDSVHLHKRRLGGKKHQSLTVQHSWLGRLSTALIFSPVFCLCVSSRHPLIRQRSGSTDQTDFTMITLSDGKHLLLPATFECFGSNAQLAVHRFQEQTTLPRARRQTQHDVDAVNESSINNLVWTPRRHVHTFELAPRLSRVDLVLHRFGILFFRSRNLTTSTWSSLWRGWDSFTSMSHSQPKSPKYVPRFHSQQECVPGRHSRQYQQTNSIPSNVRFLCCPCNFAVRPMCIRRQDFVIVVLVVALCRESLFKNTIASFQTVTSCSLYYLTFSQIHVKQIQKIIKNLFTRAFRLRIYKL